MNEHEEQVKEVTNQLNLLRLQRRNLEKKEDKVYEKLRELVFQPTPTTGVKTEDEQGFAKAEEFESESAGDDDWQQPKPVYINIDDGVKLEEGDTVYIKHDNKITHFKEKKGISKYHRFGLFEKQKGDKVYFRSLTDKRLWRLKTNLFKVINPNYNE